MKKKKPRVCPRLRIRFLHDLACSKCGQINQQDSSDTMTFAFCPQCQENTQHYSIAARQAGFETVSRQPKGKKRRSEYSPKGKKKMGFGKK
ncbi:MAG: hypothetical protein ABSF80_02725 [Chitinispirillaceae bacterium]|jgi:hypothetical protein